jgi:hypothetical protein
VYAAFPERLNLLLASQLAKEYSCSRMLLPKRAQHIDNNGRICRCHDTHNQLSDVASLHASRNARRMFSMGENQPL